MCSLPCRDPQAVGAGLSAPGPWGAAESPRGSLLCHERPLPPRAAVRWPVGATVLAGDPRPPGRAGAFPVGSASRCQRLRAPGPRQRSRRHSSVRGARAVPGAAGGRREAAFVGAPRARWAGPWVCTATVEKEERPTFSLPEACAPVTAASGPEGHQPGLRAGEGCGWRMRLTEPRAESPPAAQAASPHASSHSRTWVCPPAGTPAHVHTHAATQICTRTRTRGTLTYARTRRHTHAHQVTHSRAHAHTRAHTRCSHTHACANGRTLGSASRGSALSPGSSRAPSKHVDLYTRGPGHPRGHLRLREMTATRPRDRGPLCPPGLLTALQPVSLQRDAPPRGHSVRSRGQQSPASGTPTGRDAAAQAAWEGAGSPPLTARLSLGGPCPDGHTKEEGRHPARLWWGSPEMQEGTQPQA